MRATNPQVAESEHGIVRQRRSRVGSLVLCGRDQQVIEFFRIEAGQAEVVIGLAQFLQLEGKKLVVPSCPLLRLPFCRRFPARWLLFSRGRL